MHIVLVDSVKFFRLSEISAITLIAGPVKGFDFINVFIETNNKKVFTAM